MQIIAGATANLMPIHTSVRELADKSRSLLRLHILTGISVEVHVEDKVPLFYSL